MRTAESTTGLRPVEAALATVRRRRGVDGTRGLAPGLVVPADSPGWLPATELVSGRRLPDLLAAAGRRWRATPHVAGALAWRSYTHWLAMPAVLGWATAGRVPLVDPDDVLVHIDEDRARPLLTFGLRRVRLVVLPDDPLARTGDPAVVGSGAELLRALRATVRESHLDPLLARLRDAVSLGTRILLGSLAAGLAYGVVRGVEAPPARLAATVDTLLDAFDVADLVELEPGPDPDSDPPGVRRRTCCLAFTLPEPKICASCCLRSAPPRRP